MKRLVFLALLFCIFLFSTGVSLAQNMKEGLWEITMTMDMPGMPVKMPPQTWTQCLTKKESIPQQDKDCKVIKSDLKGDVFTWTVQCKTPDGVMTGNGRMIYRGDSFEGLVSMATSGEKRKALGVTQNLRGKWVGKCR